MKTLALIASLAVMTAAFPLRKHGPDIIDVSSTLEHGPTWSFDTWFDMGGSCHYVGQVTEIPKFEDECYPVHIWHLTYMSGADKFGDNVSKPQDWVSFSCVYDYGLVVAMTHECPDILVVSHYDMSLVKQIWFDRDENQLIYYPAGTNVAHFDAVISETGSYAGFDRYEEQIKYRDNYDWIRSCVKGDCDRSSSRNRQLPKSGAYDIGTKEPVRKTRSWK